MFTAWWVCIEGVQKVDWTNFNSTQYNNCSLFSFNVFHEALHLTFLLFDRTHGMVRPRVCHWETQFRVWTYLRMNGNGWTRCLIFFRVFCQQYVFKSDPTVNDTLTGHCDLVITCLIWCVANNIPKHKPFSYPTEMKKYAEKFTYLQWPQGKSKLSYKLGVYGLINNHVRVI